MWNQVVTFLLLGYLCMGRSFAYWGIPPWHLFIGEGALFLFLFFGPRVAGGRWIWLAAKEPEFRRCRNIFIVFFLYGIFEMFRGAIAGNSPMLAARDLALNYYPLYFFLGLWVGLQDTQYLARFFRLAAWVNGIYGALFIIALSRVGWSFPGFSENADVVQIFGQPSYSALILLGLLSFEKDLRRIWPLLALNSFVMLGMVIRAEWLGFGMGLAWWMWANRNFRRVALVGAMVVALLLLMYATNFRYDAPESRGGTISATDIVGRVLAPIDADAASDYTADVHMDAGNIVWRALFWVQIWQTVHENAGRALFGYGYGFPMNELVPYLQDNATRTPHNVFFLILGYTGWVGVVIFTLFQVEIARLFREVRRLNNEPFGMVFFVAMIGFALFTPFFETPQGAIPFYIIAGCVCAALFHPSKEALDAPTMLAPLSQEGS